MNQITWYKSVERNGLGRSSEENLQLRGDSRTESCKEEREHIARDVGGKTGECFTHTHTQGWGKT